MPIVNMRDCRIVFMGTPAFATVQLQAMKAAEWNIVGVVTQPDRPTGRKRLLTKAPVKELAETYGIPVLQPETLRSDTAQRELAALVPDVIVTAAYGQILPVAVLQLPKLGAFNLHGSLLPKYRGGAPIQWAIKNGERVSGVSLMTMVKAMDAGAVWAQCEVAIQPTMTYGQLHDELAKAGAALLLDALPKVLSGQLQAIEQDPALVSYAPTIARQDEAVDWKLAATAVYNHIRALSPRPGAYTTWAGHVLKIWNAEVYSGNEATLVGEPGLLLAMTANGPLIACGQGALRLTSVQAAGKTVQSGAEFARGRRDAAGIVLGEAEVAK